MALCENFDCKRRSFCRTKAGCESSCFIALDIYKCNVCLNKETCQDTDLYRQKQAEKEYWLNYYREKRGRKNA